MSQKKRALFIFRRDLRLVDNTALAAACATGLEVVTIFVLDRRQIEPHPYRSQNGLGFMFESLRELATALEHGGGRLYLVPGIAEELIPGLIQELELSAIFVNKDYTPFSRARDKAIAETAAAKGVSFHSYSDALLIEPSHFGKPNGGAYSIFTPFYKRAAKSDISSPRPAPQAQFFRGTVTGALHSPAELLTKEQGVALRQRGGREAGLAILSSLDAHRDYLNQRDYPARPKTTLLAAHHKFGTISIRESYHRMSQVLGRDHALIRQLFWRDFFTQIAWHFPHVFQGAFHRRYDQVAWEDAPDHVAAWKEGQTGFPIVDAGIRQLRQTGTMHNRVRMIVSSFLVKDLHCSWRIGERFFAEHLTDYDPAVNNGSWQWAASTGCDAQPYFRIFNPWLQQEKFDAECLYIKRWVPELSDAWPRVVHKLFEEGAPRILGYPSPIVDHQVAKIQAQEMFEICKSD